MDLLAVSDFNLDAILVVNSINVDLTVYTSCTPQTTPILHYLACFVAKTHANGLLRLSILIMKGKPCEQCLLVVSGFGFYHLWTRIWYRDVGVVHVLGMCPVLRTYREICALVFVYA